MRSLKRLNKGEDTWSLRAATATANAFILVFDNISNIFAAFFKELALITIREMWGLESTSRAFRSRSRLLWQSLGLEVSARSRRLRFRLHHWYLANAAIGYGWILDTKFLKFSEKDWILTCKNFFGYGSGVKISISAHLCPMLISDMYNISAVYRIRILESNPAGYLDFFDLDWFGYLFPFNRIRIIQIKCSHAKNLDMQ